jgi:chromosome segregation ATPase
MKITGWKQLRSIGKDMEYRKFYLVGLVLAMGLIHSTESAADGARKVYRWVDSKGHVHYGDTLPPTAGVTGSEQLGKSGDVVDRTESFAEKKARMAREAEQAQARKKAQEQQRQDRALLDTYTNEQEIDLARDRALEFHKSAIKSAQLRISQIQGNLEDLKKRVQGFKDQNRPVPKFMQDQLDASQSEMDGLNQTISENRQALVNVRVKYEADKQRFRQLTGR